MAACFMYELRRQRELRGLSQNALAKELYSTRGSIQAYEANRNRPDEQFARRCDEFFGTGELFQALWYHSRREHLNEWLEDYFDHERDAVDIRSFQPMTIPGPLQTEGYIRGNASKEADVEMLVGQRLTRRELLAKENGPYFWAVIDEAAIRRPVGSKGVMWEQLQLLLELSELPNVCIQIIPETGGGYDGLAGALVILTMPGGREVGFAEAQAGGRLMEDPHEVRRLAILFNQFRARALPEAASRALIIETMEKMQ